MKTSLMKSSGRPAAARRVVSFDDTFLSSYDETADISHISEDHQDDAENDNNIIDNNNNKSSTGASARFVMGNVGLDAASNRKSGSLKRVEHRLPRQPLSSRPKKCLLPLPR